MGDNNTMSSMTNHSEWLAFTRIFSAVGAVATAELLKGDSILRDIARDYAAFEARRWSTACHAARSLREALAAAKEA